MKKIIKSKNIKVTKKLENYINEKIDSLEKFINIPEKKEGRKDTKEITIEVEKETKHHKKGNLFKAEIFLNLPKKTIFAKSVSDNLNLSILEAKEEIQKEIKKYKSKKVSLKRRKEREVKKEIKLSPEARMHRKGRIREEGL